MSKYVVCIARVFSTEERAFDFIEKGKFRCNTLKFFKEYEDKHKNNIGDPNEGIISNYPQGSGAILKIKAHQAKEWHTIGDYSSLQFHSNNILNNPAFCLYAPSVEKDEKYSLDEFEGFVRIQEDAEKLGDYMVMISDPKKFFEMLRNEVEVNLGFKLKMGLVEYHDFLDQFEVPNHMVGFVKSKIFAHQKEFRVVIDRGVNDFAPLDLEIGALNDIAFMIPTKDFNSSFKVENKEELTEE